VAIAFPIALPAAGVFFTAILGQAMTPTFGFCVALLLAGAHHWQQQPEATFFLVAPY
jgi:hypothetical protein